MRKKKIFEPPTVEDIISALKLNGRYTPALLPMLAVLDSALTSLRIMLAQLRIWEKEIKNKEKTYDAIAESPLWKRLREAEDSCRKILKELDLNAEGTKSTVQEDPLLGLTEKIRDMLNNRDL